MERLQIWGGECVITEETVHIAQRKNLFLKQHLKQKPLLAALVLVFDVGLMLGAIGMAFSAILRQVPDHLFTPSWYVMIIFGLLFLGSVVGWPFWWRISLKRRLRAGTGHRNLSQEDVITRDSIDSVVFDRHQNIPVMFIKYQRTDERAVRPVYLLRNAEKEIEKARAAFRSLDIPLRGLDQPSTTSSSD